jgi:hypothetical protein
LLVVVVVVHRLMVLVRLVRHLQTAVLAQQTLVLAVTVELILGVNRAVRAAVVLLYCVIQTHFLLHQAPQAHQQ